MRVLQNLDRLLPADVLRAAANRLSPDHRREYSDWYDSDLYMCCAIYDGTNNGDVENFENLLSAVGICSGGDLSFINAEGKSVCFPSDSSEARQAARFDFLNLMACVSESLANERSGN